MLTPRHTTALPSTEEWIYDAALPADKDNHNKKKKNPILENDKKLLSRLFRGQLLPLLAKKKQQQGGVEDHHDDAKVIRQVSTISASSSGGGSSASRTKESLVMSEKSSHEMIVERTYSNNMIMISNFLQEETTNFMACCGPSPNTRGGVAEKKEQHGDDNPETVTVAASLVGNDILLSEEEHASKNNKEEGVGECDQESKQGSKSKAPSVVSSKTESVVHQKDKGDTKKQADVVVSASIDTFDSILGKSIGLPSGSKSFLDGEVSFDEDSEMLLIGERPEDEEKYRDGASCGLFGGTPSTNNEAFPARPKQKASRAAGFICGETTCEKEKDQLDEIAEGSIEDESSGIVLLTTGTVADSATFSTGNFFSDLMGAKHCDYCRKKLSLTDRRVKENRATYDVEDASVYFHRDCYAAREKVKNQKKVVHEELLTGEYKLRSIPPQIVVQKEATTLTTSTATTSTCTTKKKRFKNVRKSISALARKIKKRFTRRPKSETQLIFSDSKMSVKVCAASPFAPLNATVAPRCPSPPAKEDVPSSLEAKADDVPSSLPLEARCPSPPEDVPSSLEAKADDVPSALPLVEAKILQRLNEGYTKNDEALASVVPDLLPTVSEDLSC